MTRDANSTTTTTIHFQSTFQLSKLIFSLILLSLKCALITESFIMRLINHCLLKQKQLMQFLFQCSCNFLHNKGRRSRQRIRSSRVSRYASQGFKVPSLFSSKVVSMAVPKLSEIVPKLFKRESRSKLVRFTTVGTSVVPLE